MKKGRVIKDITWREAASAGGGADGVVYGSGLRRQVCVFTGLLHQGQSALGELTTVSDQVATKKNRYCTGSCGADHARPQAARKSPRSPCSSSRRKFLLSHRLFSKPEFPDLARLASRKKKMGGPWTPHHVRANGRELQSNRVRRAAPTVRATPLGRGDHGRRKKDERIRTVRLDFVEREPGTSRIDCPRAICQRAFGRKSHWWRLLRSEEGKNATLPDFWKGSGESVGARAQTSRPGAYIGGPHVLRADFFFWTDLGFAVATLMIDEIHPSRVRSKPFPHCSLAAARRNGAIRRA